MVLTQMLPLWGSWQREALTEGAPMRMSPSTALRAVPLPQWGRSFQ